MGGGLGDWVKKMKGLKSTNWLAQNSHGDGTYSTGNIVNNIVITVHGARWALELWGITSQIIYMSNHYTIPLQLI